MRHIQVVTDIHNSHTPPECSLYDDSRFAFRCENCNFFPGKQRGLPTTLQNDDCASARHVDVSDRLSDLVIAIRALDFQNRVSLLDEGFTNLDASPMALNE